MCSKCDELDKLEEAGEAEGEALAAVAKAARDLLTTIDVRKIRPLRTSVDTFLLKQLADALGELDDASEQTDVLMEGLEAQVSSVTEGVLS